MMELRVKKEESGEENGPIHALETEEKQKPILCGRHEP
jgi:hypothetical protein